MRSGEKISISKEKTWNYHVLGFFFWKYGKLHGIIMQF